MGLEELSPCGHDYLPSLSAIVIVIILHAALKYTQKFNLCICLSNKIFKRELLNIQIMHILNMHWKASFICDVFEEMDLNLSQIQVN